MTKDFRSGWRQRHRAVRDINFACHAGEVFALLGANGAGKTTTLRMLSTALKPTEGTATVAGHDLRRDPATIRRHIGFLSSNTGLYGRLTPVEVLTYFGRLYGLESRVLRERIEEFARVLEMESFLERPCDKLSTGMRQKVNIARTLLHRPPVLILDEPTAGLDVFTQRTILEFIRHCKMQGQTVLFSTHIMSEVERLCDRVAIIHGGTIRYCGTVEDLRREHGPAVEDAFFKLATEVA